MKSSRSVRTLILMSGTVLVAAACGKQPEPQAPTPVPEARPTDDTADREAAERAAREAEEARRRAEEEARRLRTDLEAMVFFDYDRSEIRSDARAVLDGKVPHLRDGAAIRLRIEGHADERGSTEYNVALGMRRAESVKQYLVDFGLDPNRFQVISYGEERPMMAGHDESAWARNRRAEFAITAGLPVTVPDRTSSSR